MNHPNADATHTLYRMRSAGFSLIEMLIALLIVSIAVGMSIVVVSALKAARDAAYENAAFRIAGSKLDELRAGGYEALPADGPFSDPGLARLPGASASTSVSIWNDKTKKVVAGVAWLSSDGALRYTTMTTLITDVGGL